MEQPVFPAQEDMKVKLSDIPLKWGLIIGIVGCILTTLNFTVIIKNYTLFLVFSFITFVVNLVLLYITGLQQRKAMGGFINVKQAFRAIFFAILISTLITTIYGVVYTKVIDPDVFTKVKEGTLAFMERMKVPQEKIDEQMAKFDEQQKDSMKPGKLLFSYATSLVLYSIFGFICALIVKRKKPAHQL